MYSLENTLNFVACVAAAAFFGAFVLTTSPGRVRLALATIFYGVGIMACLGTHVYFRFSSFLATHGLVLGYDQFPLLGSIMPIVLLCFGLTAAALLLPSIPQRRATRYGIVLFVVFAPLLILVGPPIYFQFHRPSSFDVKWLLYALLWFRIRDAIGTRLERENKDTQRT